MHLLCTYADLHMFKMKILKGYVIRSPVTCINLLLNMIAIFIIQYIVLDFIKCSCADFRNLYVDCC